MTTVGIIGLGYVGLPLAVAFAEQGSDVIAVDVDPRKIEAIAAGRSYIGDISSERLAAVLDRISASSSYEELGRAQAVLVCVPTPLSVNREPDLGPLVESMRKLARVLKAGQLVVLERPHIPGPHASAWHRCWKSRGLWPARTSTWPSPQSAWIPAGPTSRCALHRRCSAV